MSSTREVAVGIVNQVAIGCWQFQSEDWLIDAIDAALRQREQEVRAAITRAVSGRAKELKQMAFAPLLDSETIARFKAQAAVCDELAATIRRRDDIPQEGE
jgi:hypothetical protein